jgi:hypothetical protein
MLIAIILYKSKNFSSQIKIPNETILSLYLYNPVSIIVCVSKRLDLFFTLINLLFAYNPFNLVTSPILLALSLITTPGYLSISFTYIFYLFLTNSKQIKPIISLTFIYLIAYFVITKLIFNIDTLTNTYTIYYNYYFMKDSLPNFSDLWSLLAGTFLKYQKFTLQMLFIYQITLCMSVMALVHRIDDKYYSNKTGLTYSLIFMMSHILDKYPCENHYIISLLLLFQHWDVVKQKIMTLAVYGSFAGYTLIVCRGFPYTWRKTGSSNYLYFQNVTYEIAMTFIMMCAMNGINSFRKREKTKEKIKLCINDIIDNVLVQVNANKNE